MVLSCVLGPVVQLAAAGCSCGFWVVGGGWRRWRWCGQVVQVGFKLVLTMVVARRLAVLAAAGGPSCEQLRASAWHMQAGAQRVPSTAGRLLLQLLSFVLCRAWD